MPVAFKHIDLQKGQAIHRQRDNLLAFKWKDKRDVVMLSTVHRASFTVTNRVNRDTGENVAIPTAIMLYNKYMGGVDRSDQLNKYYTMTRKTIKWWKKLAFHIINAMITNAYILQKKYHPNPVSHSMFRKNLVRSLVGKFQREHNLRGRRYVGNPLTRLVDRHFPAEIPAQDGAKRKNPCRKCVVCNIKSGKRHRRGLSQKGKSTRYWCPDCCAALCITPCFRRYHTVKHYQRRINEDGDENESSSSDDDSSSASADD
jgi:hypothetical protein